jgi:hypothetical protein
MTTPTEQTESDICPMLTALATHLECSPNEITEQTYKHYGALAIYSYGRAEYAVGTDSDADEAWEASLDSYIEDCITPELNFSKLGNLGAYVSFDEEMWKRDARMDGRGHSLSSYDGEEIELDGGFMAFRIN